ncbi:hypothetical protein RIF29_19925 [Crotalaria pallida]|uniref:Uncharacterized protein n=1 Tax=Crotalaria pallida TaxID=3830 RepID=A0AAN9F8P0_CROPI
MVDEEVKVFRLIFLFLSHTAPFVRRVSLCPHSCYAMLCASYAMLLSKPNLIIPKPSFSLSIYLLSSLFLLGYRSFGSG